MWFECVCKGEKTWKAEGVGVEGFYIGKLVLYTTNEAVLSGTATP